MSVILKAMPAHVLLSIAGPPCAFEDVVSTY